jgi:hypothetical protein
MGLKKVFAGAALAVATSAVALAVAGAPAAAAGSISIPGMSEFELRWYCAEADGDFFGGSEYECHLPNGAIIVCRRGGNCFIHLSDIRPGEPGTPVTPIEQRPGAGGPPVITW